MRNSGNRVIIRLDATSEIGSGHAMRCLAIAQALSGLGASVEFAVSCDASAEFLQSHDADVHVLGGNPLSLGSADARSLARWCEDQGSTALLVDSYGANNQFWSELGLSVRPCCTLAAIDDMYSYEMGMLKEPTAKPVDIVVNYDFMATEQGYPGAYTLGSGCTRWPVEMLLGPTYAPVRSSFRKSRDRFSVDDVHRILVTTGSTNPSKCLERMTSACLRATDDRAVSIDVVVGALAEYSLGSSIPDRVVVHKGVNDLSSLMCASDLVVSAGGSTLYELACLGVPTIAIPIVENQVRNAQGFARMGFGLDIDSLCWSIDELESAVFQLIGDAEMRRSFSERSSRIVDGYGATRIAKALVGA